MDLVIYRNDQDYPIYASSFEEMREERAEGNRSFISHGYGSVAYDRESKNVTIFTLSRKCRQVNVVGKLR